MIRYLSVAALLAVGATVAVAQGMSGDAAVKERKDLMKAQANAMYRTAMPIIKGDKPYDQAVATGAFKVVLDTSAKLKSLWPDDSQGGEHRSLPAVWKNKSDFNGWIDQLEKDARAAMASVKDQASLKPAYDAVNASCNGCHKDYRAPSKR